MPARPSVGRTGAITVLGLTVPLLAVGGLRVPVGSDGIPLVVCALLATAGLFSVRHAFGRVSIAEMVGTDSALLAVALLAFWTWHLFAATRAIVFGPAMVEHAKLTVGMVCFAVLLGSRRLISGNIERLWGTCIVVSAFVLAALMFRYAFVFGMPYLGNDWALPTRFGKNQLGWFLAVTMPFVLVNFACSNRGWKFLVPTVIHVLAWMYVASRGSWVCGTLGTVLALCFARGMGVTRRALGRFVLLATLLLCAAGAVLSLVDLPVKMADLDIVTRLMDGGSLSPAQHSNKLRWDLIKHYTELFEQSPLIGIGLRNSLYSGGYVSHNDVIAILAEQGLLGIGLFSLVLTLAIRSIFASPRRQWSSLASRGASVSMLCYLLLINAYASPMFWILLALVMVSSGERAPCPVGDARVARGQGT